MKLIPKFSILDITWGLFAIGAGALVVYLGDQLLGVKLEIFSGFNTYNIFWVLDLILVPFIAGLLVSFIYGLGGKILAHFSPLVIRVIEYYSLDQSSLHDGIAVLPLGFWILVVIVTVEAAAAGGFVGEVVVKRTYGRSPRYLIHKKYQAEKPNSVD